MTPIRQAFEIGYSPSLEVIDHSEMFPSCLPGTPHFENFLLPKIKERLNAAQLHEIGQLADLFPRIMKLVDQKQAEEYFRIGEFDFTLTWEQPAARMGIYSLLVASQIAFVSFLVCRSIDTESDEMAWSETMATNKFTTTAGEFATTGDFQDHRKFRLIEMTRRPLLTSVFWPPYSPTGDSIVRTIQLQVVYAFFRKNGEIP